MDKVYIPEIVAIEIEKIRSISSNLDFSSYVNWNYLYLLKGVNVRVLRDYFCLYPHNYIKAVKDGYEIEPNEEEG